ncbi:MAG: hypothetical protein KDB21_18195 [Acidimicrobiales bacterium]|nr:hypothetical protein [Acidimicrobiales bacterium]
MPAGRRGSGSQVAWPGGKRFAFTIFDDTDKTTLANGPVVYDLLTSLGIEVTKSVWPVSPSGPPVTGGTTCDDPDYLTWVLELQEAGHEIGYHNASDHTSTREETIAALDRFEDLFGHAPRVGADHAGNVEAMYLGRDRLTGVVGSIYERAMSVSRPDRAGSQGHLPTSPHFWGDVLRDRIEYWRSFTFHEVDVLRNAPTVPYHDPARHYVNWWFPSLHAPGCAEFVEALRPEAIDRLEADGGACIVYTHFGVDFVRDGALDPAFRDLMKALADRDGWFAPTSAVLDHLRHARPPASLTPAERRSIELRWISDQLRARAGSEALRAVRRLRR